MKEPHPIADIINNLPKDLTYEEIYNQLKLNHIATRLANDNSLNLFLDITALHFDPDKQSYPFSVKLKENAHVELIDQMRSHIDHPDISWLLHDLFWTQQRKPENARLASEHACKSATSLNPNTSSLEVFKRIKRAIILSNQSQNNDAREETKNAIGLITEKCLKDPKNFLSVWLINLLIEINAHSILSKLIKSELISNAAIQTENSKDWELAQRLRQAIVDTLKVLKFEDLAQKSLIYLAHSYEKQAIATSNGMISSLAYQKAIRSLQLINVPSLCAERDALIKQFQLALQDAQTKRLKELKPISVGPLDMTPFLLSLEKALDKAHSFEESLLVLATLSPLQNKAALESRIADHLQQLPHSLFAMTEYIDERGRTLNHPSSFEEKVSHHVTRELSIHWDMQAHLINHARQWIIRCFSVLESDWLNVISHNPYIPLGHHEIIARALYQGLNADLLNSTHLLPPQFEASCRHILDLNNINCQVITNNLKQKDQSIKELLAIPDITKFISEDFCFEVSRLLTEDGLNLRNNGLHGKMMYLDFYQYRSLYLWYLAIKFFCFAPLLLKPPTQGESTSTTDK